MAQIFTRIMWILVSSILIFFMTATNWGTLQKSAEDSSTIDDAIAQAIADHEADPEAHLGDGESLQAHKSEDVIDHPAGSIIQDKIPAGQLILDQMSYQRMFIPLPIKDLNLSSAGSSSFTNIFYSEIWTGASTNTFYTAISGGDETENLIGDITTNPSFRITCFPSNTSSMKAYFGIGDFEGDSAFGFKFDGTALKAVWYDTDAVEHLITISGIDIAFNHVYSGMFKDGYQLWFVDGVQVASRAFTVLNTACTGGNVGMTFSIIKTTSSNRVLYVYQAYLEQDFFA